MVYKCSLCGGEVLLQMLLSNPPIPKYVCTKCGAVRQEEPIRSVPIVIDMNQDRPCLWDGMPETSPGSGVKIAGLSCPCPKCTPHC